MTKELCVSKLTMMMSRREPLGLRSPRVSEMRLADVPDKIVASTLCVKAIPGDKRHASALYAAAFPVTGDFIFLVLLEDTVDLEMVRRSLTTKPLPANTLVRLGQPPTSKLRLAIVGGNVPGNADGGEAAARSGTGCGLTGKGKLRARGYIDTSLVGTGQPCFAS
jgi:hypothetical protein